VVERLYLAQERLSAAIVLTGEEAHHLLHVKRCRPGEPVEIFTGDGTVYRAVVTEVSGARRGTGARLTLTVEGREPPRGVGRRECPVTISVVVPVARGKRMDTLVEKLSELGVAELWPVTTARSVVPAASESASRREHWRRIAIEAARQCGRATLLRIQEGRSLDQAAEALRARPLRLAASLSGAPVPLADVLGRHALGDVAIFIGPEGDFDPAELQELVAAGALPVSLGPTVLRMETAAIVAAAAVALWANASALAGRDAPRPPQHEQEGKEEQPCPRA
jgi:16S rRNA (uracil1498-N3)-methyltransferase